MVGMMSSGSGPENPLVQLMDIIASPAKYRAQIEALDKAKADAAAEQVKLEERRRHLAAAKAEHDAAHDANLHASAEAGKAQADAKKARDDLAKERADLMEREAAILARENKLVADKAAFDAESSRRSTLIADLEAKARGKLGAAEATHDMARQQAEESAQNVRAADAVVDAVAKAHKAFVDAVNAARKAL